jgi:hypothetical protein
MVIFCVICKWGLKNVLITVNANVMILMVEITPFENKFNVVACAVVIAVNKVIAKLMGVEMLDQNAAAI